MRSDHHNIQESKPVSSNCCIALDLHIDTGVDGCCSFLSEVKEIGSVFCCVSVCHRVVDRLSGNLVHLGTRALILNYFGVRHFCILFDFVTSAEPELLR